MYCQIKDWYEVRGTVRVSLTAKQKISLIEELCYFVQIGNNLTTAITLCSHPYTEKRQFIETELQKELNKRREKMDIIDFTQKSYLSKQLALCQIVLSNLDITGNDLRFMVFYVSLFFGKDEAVGQIKVKPLSEIEELVCEARTHEERGPWYYTHKFHSNDLGDMCCACGALEVDYNATPCPVHAPLLSGIVRETNMIEETANTVDTINRMCVEIVRVAKSLFSKEQPTNRSELGNLFESCSMLKFYQLYGVTPPTEIDRFRRFRNDKTKRHPRYSPISDCENFQDEERILFGYNMNEAIRYQYQCINPRSSFSAPYYVAMGLTSNPMETYYVNMWHSPEVMRMHREYRFGIYSHAQIHWMNVLRKKYGEGSIKNYGHWPRLKDIEHKWYKPGDSYEKMHPYLSRYYVNEEEHEVIELRSSEPQSVGDGGEISFDWLSLGRANEEERERTIYRNQVSASRSSPDTRRTQEPRANVGPRKNYTRRRR